MRSALPALRAPVARATVAGPSRVTVPAFSRAASTAPKAKSSELPPNITFEDNAGAKKQVGLSLLSRGKRLHVKPRDPFEPITHPLSSLASTNPTLPTATAISLPSDVFGKPLRKDILHRNVVWYLSTLRAGNQSTKNRSTVAYSGRKLRAQKGSGKARVGDASSGIRRGGAPIHALKPRDWAQELPRKVRELGLHTALSTKLSSGLLRIVADLNEAEWQGTNDAVRRLGDGPANPTNVADPGKYTERFGPRNDLSILFIHSPNKPAQEVDNLWLKLRNIPKVELLPSDEVLAYDVLKYRWVVAEAAAIDALSGDAIQFGSDPEFDREIEALIRGDAPALPEPVKHVKLDGSAAAPAENSPSA